MARCPSCDYPLPSDRERLGARCPRCRDPLYEPPGGGSRTAREGEGACAAHPRNEAVGTCGRCGNYLCAVCRTPWRKQVLCTACVGRALESREASPEQARTHFRQAVLSVVLGLGAWALSFLAFLIAIPVEQSGSPAGKILVVLAFLVFFGDFLPALAGLGQAATALRTRGNHMILATVGLIVSGLYVGVVVGLFAMGLWLS